MQIQVLGSGCKTCKTLYELTQKAVAELEKDISVEYITDITRIIEMGVMTSPVLAINGVPVLIGSTASIDKIKELITNAENKSLGGNTNSESNKIVSKCSCHGGCC